MTLIYQTCIDFGVNISVYRCRSQCRTSVVSISQATESDSYLNAMPRLYNNMGSTALVQYVLIVIWAQQHSFLHVPLWFKCAYTWSELVWDFTV